MTRLAIAIAAVGIAAVGIALSTTAPASADAVAARVTAVGWWSRQPGASAQPAGGFQVAYGVQGTESVAAVRIDVPTASNVHATLDLTETSSSAGAAMRLCTTVGGWTPANPGTYQQAPPANCSRPVSLTRDPKTMHWKADITPLVTSGSTANLMVEPVAPAGSTQVNAGFTVTVKSASVTAEGTPPAAGPAPANPAQPAPVAAPAQGTPSTLVAVQPAIAPTPIAPPTTKAVATALPPATSPAIASPTFTPQVFHHNRPWGRLIVILPIAALIGAGAAAIRRARGSRLSVS